MAPVACSSAAIARETSSRGASSSTKRSPSGPCSVAPSPRIASVTRKPSRPGDADDGGRVKLQELEVGELGARGVGDRHPDPQRARRVRRARPQRGRAAGGEDRRAGAHRAAVLERDAGAAAVVHPRARGARALQHRDARLVDDERRELAHDAPAGRAAAGVHDAAHRVPALEAEREHAAAVGVEAHAHALEVAHARRRLADEHLRGRAAHEVAAGGLGVGEMALEGVLDRERGGDPALRPVARGLRERGRRDERDRGAGGGGVQRGVQPGRTGSDDREVAADHRFVGHRRGTVLRCPRRSSFTIPRRWSTTPAGTPRTRAGSSRSSGR